MSDAGSRSGTKVAVLVDEEIAELCDDGTFGVERGTMEASVVRALAARGMRTCIVPFDPLITPTVETLRAFAPALVFNLTEWVAGDRRHDAAIAGVLELMGLRYTGAGPECMRLARDKALAKAVVAGLGVGIAPHVVVNGTMPDVAALGYPLMLKPQFGDGSDGITAAAVVSTARQFEMRLAQIRRRSDAALLAERYVEGRDLFVALLGDPPRVLPPLELVIARRAGGAPRIATARIKNDPAYRRRWAVSYRRARLAPALLAQVERASLEVFRALGLRDYARIDFRLAADDRLVFLEANPNPDLTPNTFGRGVCFPGVRYPDLIGAIVDTALGRAA